MTKKLVMHAKVGRGIGEHTSDITIDVTRFAPGDFENRKTRSYYSYYWKDTPEARERRFWRGVFMMVNVPKLRGE